MRPVRFVVVALISGLFFWIMTNHVFARPGVVLGFGGALVVGILFSGTVEYIYRPEKKAQ